jgi:hypothetical protein
LAERKAEYDVLFLAERDAVPGLLFQVHINTAPYRGEICSEHNSSCKGGCSAFHTVPIREEILGKRVVPIVEKDAA